MTWLIVLALGRARADARFPVIGCDAVLAAEFSRRPRPLAEGPFRRSDLVSTEPRITPETIRAAYRNGLFPWGSVADNRGKWSLPRQRGVLRFCDLAVPRKDRRLIARDLASDAYVFTENEDVARILDACARDYRFTWLDREMVAAYLAAFDEGLVVADAAWVNLGDGRRGELAAAMYGVDVDGVYSGESMRHFRSDALKPLLWRRIERLRAMGREFMDVQEAHVPADPPRPGQSISLAVKWGAREIPRKAYLRLLREAQAKHVSLAAGGTR